MRLLWTTSGKVGAKIIRWGLSSDCSHFAVVFDEDHTGRGLVFHSTSHGIGIGWFRQFLEVNHVVHALRPVISPSLDAEEKIYKSILDRYYSSGYDFSALKWWVLWGFIHKIFGWPLPGRNRWDSSKDFLCTEVAPHILHYLGIEPPNVDYAMISPHDLFLELLSSPHLELDAAWKEAISRG